MFKLSSIALSILGLSASLMGPAAQASPIGLTVIPEATCEIIIAKSPRNTRINGLLKTRSGGVGKYYLTVDDLRGDIMHRQEMHGAFRMGKDNFRYFGAIYLTPFAEGISATLRVNWQGKEITCTKKEPVKPFRNQFGIGAILP